MKGTGTFSVDTHVFRELGELLVGRDSTALLELIKNSYDADATLIVVTADVLGDLKRGRIIIEDNGHGMDEASFRSGFLTIAARSKEGGDRRSEHHRRRYTGSKGIGRLAAHKLAKHMRVESISGTPGELSAKSILASIDWERIEEKETLAQLTNEVGLQSVALAKARTPGTVITLSKLRRPWTDKEKVRFVSECRSFLVPEVLTNPLPGRVLAKPLLFASPQLRDAGTKDPGCTVRLQGDFDEGDDYWAPLVDLTDWILEIDCKSDKRVVKYGVAPSREKAYAATNGAVRRFAHPHPNPTDGPFFQARVLVRDRKIQSRDLGDWSRQHAGIRIYMEGFRVLPYGEAGDDWLSIDANYSRRSWQTDDVFDKLVKDEEDAGDWQLLVLSNKSYTGAIFLTQEDAPTLRMLVNREGFVTERAFDHLAEIVRRGLDLVTRARAAATAEDREERRKQRERDRRGEPATPVQTGEDEYEDTQRRTFAEASNAALKAVHEARRTVEVGADSVKVAQSLVVTESAIVQLVSVGDKLKDSAAMLRVLASLGLQMASFVHEIRGLLGAAIVVHEAVGRIRENAAIRGEVRARLNEVYASLGDQRRQIERQSSYLVDIASTDARRRRTRQSLAERFDSAGQLISLVAERRGVRIINQIPRDLKSPPMFPAELTAVFSNLLTNALKAAGEGKSIRARGKKGDGDQSVVIVENTGERVNLADSERWFRPFESSTVDVNSSVGYGMGLGLTITRDILEQYGASVKFVEPADDFATAVEIVFPNGR
jgi:signal transduction histidine kinase